MPAEAGIQSVGDNNNFKDLDSRFRGNDGVFPITTQSLMGEGRVGVMAVQNSTLFPFVPPHPDPLPPGERGLTNGNEIGFRRIE
jgi:hypothetical protein